ncbi:retention module-containing protein [Methylophilus sp. 3sh_L]|uniref:retention module-containing protein n=1 Tax=Methylophilus sp. 3sh_L TaxID=3377114 RepID=UPI00398E49CA
MHNMVAKISHLEGQVEVVNAMGQQRQLVAGEWLREGERIVAHEGAQVSLETTAGDSLRVQGQQSMTLNAQLNADYLPHASDDAIDAQLLQHVLASLQAGDSFLDTAALLLPDSAFSAFATDNAPAATEPLHIADLLPDHGTGHTPSSHVVDPVANNGMVDLMAATSLPSDILLQQQLIKDIDHH